MAMRVIPTTAKPKQVGADVSKHSLEISIDGQKPFSLANERQAIKRWLGQLQGPIELALEATSHYHLLLADLAHEAGHQVFLINGYCLNHYRAGTGGRAKNDQADALLLVRYLQNERQHLTPWQPPCAEYREIMALLGRRATLVQAKGMLQQSLGGMETLETGLQGLIHQIKQVEGLIERRILQLLKQTVWGDNAKRCMAIEGVGRLTGAALATAFQRGNFRSSDAFVAFLGLDVRVRDSGTFRGKRKLTKKGNSEIRRLLYMAAMTARRMPAWRDTYQRYLDRGLASTQALNILARKIVRVAFALMKNQTEYRPKMA